MKKEKQLIIGIVLLLVCIGGYFGVKAYNSAQEKKEEAKTMTPVDVQVSDITGFSYINDGAAVSFVKEGEDWKYSADTSLDMKEDSINEMLEKACGVTSTETIQAETLSDYGFDSPTNTITLDTKKGSTVIKIGMLNEMLSKYYISINDSKELYLVESDIVTGFDQTVENLKVAEPTAAAEDTDNKEKAEETTEEEKTAE